MKELRNIKKWSKERMKNIGRLKKKSENYKKL